MIRALCVIPLLLAGLGACTPDPAANANSEVDIENAAREAQGTVNAYGEGLAAERAGRRVKPKPTSIPTPTPSPTATPTPLPPPATPGGEPDDRTPISRTPVAPDGAQGAA